MTLERILRTALREHSTRAYAAADREETREGKYAAWDAADVAEQYRTTLNWSAIERAKCRGCYGNGNGYDDKTCRHCHGYGYIPNPSTTPNEIRRLRAPRVIR